MRRMTGSVSCEVGPVEATVDCRSFEMEYVGASLNSFLRCLVGFSEGSFLEGIQCPQICRIANTPRSNSSPYRRGISGGEGQEASASFGRGHGLNLHLQGTARARDLCLLRSGMKCSSCFSRARQSASSYFNSVSLQPKSSHSLQ